MCIACFHTKRCHDMWIAVVCAPTPLAPSLMWSWKQARTLGTWLASCECYIGARACTFLCASAPLGFVFFRRILCSCFDLHQILAPNDTSAHHTHYGHTYVCVHTCIVHMCRCILFWRFYQAANITICFHLSHSLVSHWLFKSTLRYEDGIYCVCCFTISFATTDVL